MNTEHDKEFDQHVDKIIVRVRDRLIDLGLIEQLPSRGVMRIIQEVSLAYWAEDEAESQEFSPETVQIKVSPAEGMPVEGSLYTAEAPNGMSIPIAFVSVPDNAMYIQGHKITIGLGEETGRVYSRHRDNSPCTVGCYNCDKPEVFIGSTDEEFYAYCASCDSKTATHPDKWQALAAWLVGQIGKEPHAESIFGEEG